MQNLIAALPGDFRIVALLWKVSLKAMLSNSPQRFVYRISYPTEKVVHLSVLESHP